MHTEVVEVGPYERMLTFRLEEPTLEEAKSRVARKLSRELKIKGFRPGKAPRAVVERMVGPDRLRGEAIEEAIPSAVADAIVRAELSPVTTPRVEDVRDVDGGSVEIDIHITLWPSIDTLPDYSGREVTVAIEPVEDEEIVAQIDRLRSQYAELEEVDRAGDEGDFVLINITAQAQGTEIEEASASGLLYEIGSKSFIPGLDDLLVAASAGDIREGPVTLPQGFGDHAGTEVTLKVLVKDVRAKRLPEVTDEWVSDVSEFDTIEELEDTLRENLTEMKRSVTLGAFRDDLMSDLLDDLELELPETLLQVEMEAALHNIHHALEGQGIDLATYLQVTGQEEKQFADQMRDDAVRSLSTRVLLEGVAEAEGLEINESDLVEAHDALAASSGKSLEEVRSALTSSGQEQALSNDILRRKALDLLMEKARSVDADGNDIDLLSPKAEAEDGGKTVSNPDQSAEESDEE